MSAEKDLKPYEVLELFLKKNGHSRYTLSKLLGKSSSSIFTKIFKGTQDMTKTLSEDIAKVFGQDPMFWYNVWQDYKYKTHPEEHVLLDDGSLSPYISANRKPYTICLLTKNKPNPNHIRLSLLEFFRGEEELPFWQERVGIETEMVKHALKHINEYLFEGEIMAYCRDYYLPALIAQLDLPVQRFKFKDIDGINECLGVIGEGPVNTNVPSVDWRKRSKKVPKGAKITCAFYDN